MALSKSHVYTVVNTVVCSIGVLFCCFTYSLQGPTATQEDDQEGAIFEKHGQEVPVSGEGGPTEEMISPEEETTVTELPRSGDQFIETETEPVTTESIHKESISADQENAITDTDIVTDIDISTEKKVSEFPQKEMGEKKKEKDVTVTEEHEQQFIQEPEMGIDTVTLAEPQGNWLYKRIWWQRAELKYEKIRKLVEAVSETRMIFIARRADIDKNILDPFYMVIGFGQGELQRIIDELMGHFEKDRETGTFTDAEQDLFKQFEKDKDIYKQIKRDIDGVIMVNKQLNKALNALFNLIGQVRTYERETWQHFKDIARVLSDTQARKLYYEMDIIAKNITNIQTYIMQEFAQYFDQLETMITDQVDRLKDAITSLKEKGLDLREQLDRLEKKMEPCKITEPVERHEAEEEREEKEEKGLFVRYIIHPIAALFSTLGSALQSCYEWVANSIFSAVPDEKREESEEKIVEHDISEQQAP